MKQKMHFLLVERKGWIPLLFVSLILLTLFILPTISTIVLLAFFLAYAIQPWIEFLTTKLHVPRSLSAGLAILILMLMAIGIILIIIPSIAQQLIIAFAKIPPMYEHMHEYAAEWAKQLGFKDKDNISSIKELTSYLSTFSLPLVQGTTKAFTMLFKQTFSVLSLTFNSVILVVIAFITASHFTKINKSIHILIPLRYRDTESKWEKKFDRILSGFIRGQLTVAFILGCFYIIGFSFAGIEWAFSLGALVGILCLVPYAGIFTAFVISIFLVGVQTGGSGILSVLIVFTIIQTIDTMFITPNIMGKKVGIHPVFVIVALFAGGELAGLLGILVAVPLFALLKLVIEDMIETYKKSDFYQEDITATLHRTHPGEK
ncbi:AI-2E family transporter [bacterium]|nr:AI-2E family transporter [bacterium]